MTSIEDVMVIFLKISGHLEIQVFFVSVLDLKKLFHFVIYVKPIACDLFH